MYTNEILNHILAYTIYKHTILNEYKYISIYKSITYALTIYLYK